MQLAKFRANNHDQPGVGFLEAGLIHPCRSGTRISDILYAPDAAQAAHACRDPNATAIPLEQAQLLAPIDDQEIWGAGVTYERSKVARQDESESGGSFYDQVYRADRPELFFKATPSRVAGPGQPIRVRRDSKWSVPEPELALVLAPDLRLVGFTIGNDVSARDIEGRNPLYLPQAKVYDASCGLGPVVTLTAAMPPENAIAITLRIQRGAELVFEGRTSTARLARKFAELIAWLGRDNTFPNGVALLTGTGIVPPDEFSLQNGDRVEIEIEGIGVLANPVVQDAP